MDTRVGLLNLLSQEMFLQVKTVRYALAAGVPLRTRWELTTLPRPLLGQSERAKAG